MNLEEQIIKTPLDGKRLSKLGKNNNEDTKDQIRHIETLQHEIYRKKDQLFKKYTEDVFLLNNRLTELNREKKIYKGLMEATD